MRARIATIGMLLLLSVAVLMAQKENDLYQQGLARETAGDIQGAIQIFQRIVREFSSNRPLTARATLQLARWSDLLGQDQARHYYEQITTEYNDQIAQAAEARKWLNSKTSAPIEIATPFTNSAWSFALSPDGKSLVFLVTANGKSSLWLRHLDTGKQGPIAGTESQGYGGVNGANPFWSPDGRFIGYFEDRTLKTIPVTGGASKPLAPALRNMGGTWNDKGDIVFCPDIDGPVFRVSASGGDVVQVTNLDSGTYAHRYPRFLPDGRHFSFQAILLSRSASLTQIGSLDGGEVKTLPLSVGAIAFAPPNHIVFAAGGGLHAQAFDPHILELTGSPVQLAQRVATFLGNSGAAAFSVSAAGPIAYRERIAPRRRIVWRDRSGKETSIGNQALMTAMTGVPRFSASGRDVSFARNDQSTSTTILNLDGPYFLELYVGLGVWSEASPIWSADGSSLVFSAIQPPNTHSDFFQASTRLSASEGRTRILSSGEDKTPTDLKGNFLLFNRTSPTTGADIMVVSVPGTDEPVPVAVTAAREANGRFSPDGKWIVYESDELGGRNEIFVQPFPGTTSHRHRVSIGGGSMAQWSWDGKALYFLSPDNRLMTVPAVISADGTDIEVGKPASLFLLPEGSTYAPAPDGRFLVSEPVEAAAPILVLPNPFGGKP